MSASDPRTNIGSVNLQCGHKAKFDPPPQMHDIVYCRLCCNWSHVIGGDQASIPELYLRRMRCKDCIYRPRHHYDLEYMQQCAESHAIKYGHELEIWDGAGGYHLVTRRSVTGSLSNRSRTVIAKPGIAVRWIT